MLMVMMINDDDDDDNSDNAMAYDDIYGLIIVHMTIWSSCSMQILCASSFTG